MLTFSRQQNRYISSSGTTTNHGAHPVSQATPFSESVACENRGSSTFKFPETDLLLTHLSKLDFELLQHATSMSSWAGGRRISSEGAPYCMYCDWPIKVRGQQVMNATRKFVMWSLTPISSLFIEAKAKSIRTAQQCSSYSRIQRRKEGSGKG